VKRRQRKIEKKSNRKRSEKHTERERERYEKEKSYSYSPFFFSSKKTRQSLTTILFSPY
jgi:hypothetical protein